MTDLADIIAVPTQAQKLADLLAAASAAGFPTTSWQSGSVPRTILEIEAQTLVDLLQYVADTASGGYADLSSGEWLTLLARNRDVERDPGVTTTGLVTLSCAANAGPYTISGIWVRTISGLRYRTTTTGTLSSGGTLQLAVEAESVGSAYNVANGAIGALVTSLPGVTVSNPDPGGGTWITRAGADEETDEQLRQRYRDVLSTVGSCSTAASYRYWAREASSEVRRVVVREHDDLGTDRDGYVTVVLAAEIGTVSAAAVADVTAYIADRRPLTATVRVAAARTAAFGVLGTLYVRAGANPNAGAEAALNVQNLPRDLVIGETVYRSAIIEQAMLPVGVVNFVLTSPAVDVPLAWDEVALITPTITVVEVP